MPEPANVMPATMPSATAHPDQILRFRLSERQMHWAVALPFMVCFVTAAVLILVYNPNPQRAFRPEVSWTHRIAGLVLIVAPAWVAIRHWYDVVTHLDNVREVWRWTSVDMKWLFAMGHSMVNKQVIMPEQGKFNAAEKLNFMVLTLTGPLYLVSGVLIWTHQYSFPAWVLHLLMAGVATPLVFGHIFMATINPDTRVGLSGMTTGMVDRHWASHHYGRWYRDHFTEVDLPEAASAVPAASRDVAEEPVDAPAPAPTPPRAAAPGQVTFPAGRPA